MNINESLVKSINSNMDNIGLDIELSKDFKEDFFNVYEEVEKGNIRTYIKGGFMDNYMFLYAFARMLEEGKISINFNENATEKDLNYLEKLSDSL